MVQGINVYPAETLSQVVEYFMNGPMMEAIHADMEDRKSVV